MPRRLLNIASIVCLVLCVALMGMWVRSYWRNDVFGRYWGNQFVGLATHTGEVGLTFAEVPNHEPTPWRIFSNRIGPDDVQPGVFQEQQLVPIHRTLGVRWIVYANSVQIGIRFFLLTIAFGLLAFSCWRPWRFSFRTLFIVTTFLAVVLGMIAWLDRAWIGK